VTNRRLAVVMTLAVVALGWAAGGAMARPMQVVDSHPRALEVIEGKQHVQFSLRFDGPVDHRQSLIQILDPNGVAVRVMHPLLDSAPDVLFASGPGLTAGSYQLRWVVRSLPDGDVSSGVVPFSVKQ